jgi:hypothetical protein
MWQVYLYLANERQANEHHMDVKRRATGGSRIRRWRKARRTAGVQHVATEGR